MRDHAAEARFFPVAERFVEHVGAAIFQRKMAEWDGRRSCGVASFVTVVSEGNSRFSAWKAGIFGACWQCVFRRRAQATLRARMTRNSCQNRVGVAPVGVRFVRAACRTERTRPFANGGKQAVKLCGRSRSPKDATHGRRATPRRVLEASMKLPVEDDSTARKSRRSVEKRKLAKKASAAARG